MHNKIIAGPDTWIEGEAIQQLEAVSKRPGMLRCIGMPDIHPAKGSPNGAVFLADRIYPDIVGTDAGCGVNLSKITLKTKKAKLDRLAELLNGLDEPWNGDTAEFLQNCDTEPTAFDASLGTPGYSNHFVEIQAINDIRDKTLFNNIGMEEDILYVLVHSGSRGYGESILNNYATKHGAEAVAADSPEGGDYLEHMDNAIGWAKANRRLCVERVLEATGASGDLILDVCHNSVTESIENGCSCWLHRKGAAPMDQGPVVIPGSRNTLSYVVQPTGSDESLYSLAHGAGRKIKRGDAFGKLETLYKGRDIKKNASGGRVVCGDRSLLWEEAPECYKPIETVINDLKDAGLIEIIATLRPLVTFKTSEGTEEKFEQNRKKWQQERSQARNAKRRY